jgi:hypothetical protein
VLSLNVLACCHISISYVTYYDIIVIHQRFQTMHSHASRCHHCQYCNVDFVLFRNVTRYTNSLLSCIHMNIVDLLNITCTLITTCMILGRLGCIWCLAIQSCFVLFLPLPPKESIEIINWKVLAQWCVRVLECLPCACLWTSKAREVIKMPCIPRLLLIVNGTCSVWGVVSDETKGAFEMCKFDLLGGTCKEFGMPWR